MSTSTAALGATAIAAAAVLLARRRGGHPARVRRYRRLR
jgi:hypothetical protein